MALSPYLHLPTCMPPFLPLPLLPSPRSNMQLAFQQLLFYGGHVVLTAPVDPRDMFHVRNLVSYLTGTSLACAGEVLAGQELGASSRTQDAHAAFTRTSLPSVREQVLPLSCNFPG